MHPVFIIAEAGVNHNGDITLAKELIDVAAEAGADAVKFQTFKAETLVSRKAPKAAYQKETTAANETQFDMIRKLELNLNAHQQLIAHCRVRKVIFLSSPFDLSSIDLLHQLGVEIFKIPSGEITNLPYLRRVAALGKPVILSTGMACLSEIEAAVKELYLAGLQSQQLTLLHCNTEYPTPMADVNLRAMRTLASHFDVEVGYSDHTLGIEVPIAAVAMGAQVIEKHITLDNNLPGPDHRASLEPHELMEMVSAIRHIELAMGQGIKEPSASEMKNITAIRKSLVAAASIRKGELFSSANLTTMRPGNGISPMCWDEVIGKRAARNFSPGEQVSL